MNKSSNGDIILIENGIYSGSNNTNININKDLVILGKDTIIDANQHNVFTISKTATLTLKGIKIINANNLYGGAIYNYGTLNLINCSINNCKATSYGGAIYNELGTVNIINSTISDNYAGSQGGAIHTEYGAIKIQNSLIANNCAVRGGAIYNEYGTMNIENSVFDGNTIHDNSGLGGAIKNWGTTTVYNTLFIDNDGAYEGGAIYNFYNITIINSTFIQNTATYGGAINNALGSLIIKNSKITNNQGKFGSGIYNLNGEILIVNNSIVNNTVSSKTPINALYNWWGNNENPLIQNNVNASNWYIMKFSSQSNNITQNESTVLIISLNNLYDNITKTITPTPTSINGDVKIESSDFNTIAKLSNGISLVKFISENGENVSATFDNQKISLNILKQNITGFNQTIPSTNSTGENKNVTNFDKPQIAENNYSNTTDPDWNEIADNKPSNISEKISQKTGNPLIMLLINCLMIPLKLKRKE